MHEPPVPFDIDKTYLVIAKNYQCFTMWCRKYDLNPNNRSKKPRVLYVDNDQQFRGYDPKRIIIYQVCVLDWSLDNRYNRFRDLISHVYYYVDLGARVVSDECIANGPSIMERFEAEEERRRRDGR